MQSKPDKRKQSLYFPQTVLEQLQAEAARLDRSMSWIVQYAWQLSLDKVRALPAIDRAGAQPPAEAESTQAS